MEEHRRLSAPGCRLTAVTPPTVLPPPPGDAWRAEVGTFRADERRRRFPMGVHVGEPGAARWTAVVPWPVPEEYDAGLRLDLVTGLLDALLAAATSTDPDGGEAQPRPSQAWAWLTRPGEPVLHDRDLEWYSAAAHSFAAYDLELLGFRAVTRSGWLDVVTGEQRVWRRLRL